MLLFAPLKSPGYKNNLLKEKGAAKDCNVGELCCASCSCGLSSDDSFMFCVVFLFFFLILLVRFGREAVEVRVTGAAGRSRAKTERRQGTTERGQRRGKVERTGGTLPLL